MEQQYRSFPYLGLRIFLISYLLFPSQVLLAEGRVGGGRALAREVPVQDAEFSEESISDFGSDADTGTETGTDTGTQSALLDDLDGQAIAPNLTSADGPPLVTNGGEENVEGTVPAPRDGGDSPSGGSTERFFAESGDSRYSIPIPVPAGRGGLTPSIGLSYSSSNSSTDIVGKGWSLSGLYKIERSGPGGSLPSFGGGGDVFNISSPIASGELACLDVNQQDDKWICGSTYETIQRSFAKIKRDITNNLWTATGHDGTVYTFGGTTETTRGNGTGDTSFDLTHTWLIRKVRDLKGNSIEYKWQSITGHVSIESISYSGRKILFRYEPFSASAARRLNMGRGDVDYLSQFLKKIYVVYNGNTLGGMTLDYNATGAAPNPATEKYLTTVQQFGPLTGSVSLTDITDTSVSPPAFPEKVTFKYSVQPISSQNSGAWEAFDTSWNVPVAFADPSQKEQQIRFGDFNGDGLTDIIKAEKTLGGGGQEWAASHGIYLGTGVNEQGFSSSEIANGANAITFGFGYSNAQDNLGLSIGDFNGDGCSDVYEAYGSYPWQDYIKHRLHYSNCGANNQSLAFNWTETNGPRALDLAENSARRTVDYGVRTTDFNQDGRTDLFKVCSTKSVYVPSPSNRCGDGGLYLSYGSTAGGFRWLADISTPIHIDEDDPLESFKQSYNSFFSDKFLLQNIPFPYGWPHATLFGVSFSDFYLPFSYEYENYPEASGSAGNSLIDINGDGALDIIAPRDSHYATTYTKINGPTDQIFWGNGRNTPEGYFGFTWFSPFAKAGAPYMPQISQNIPEFYNQSHESLGRSFMDLNGDGLIDILSPEGGYINDGIRGDFVSPFIRWIGPDVRYKPASQIILVDPAQRGAPTGFQALDINGDGLEDLVQAGGTTNYNQQYGAALARGSYPGLLKSITLPTGGTVNFEYKPSTDRSVHKWDGINSRMGRIKQLVAKIVLDDGRATDTSRIVTEHEYFNGNQINAEENQFFKPYWRYRAFGGFERVRITKNPATPAQVVTERWYNNWDPFLNGKLRFELVSLSGSGEEDPAWTPSLDSITAQSLISFTENTYQEPDYNGGQVPFFTPLLTTRSYKFEGEKSISIESRKSYSYDQSSGAVTVVSDAINGEPSLDDPHPMVITRNYVKNQALGLVLPCSEKSAELVGGAQVPLTLTMTGYPGTTLSPDNCSAEPSSPYSYGTVTYGYKNGSISSGLTRAVCTQFDSWGNVESTAPATVANGNVFCASDRAKTVTFDSVDHVLPISTTEAGLTATVTYHPQFLRPEKAVAATGVTTTTIYDSLGRAQETRFKAGPSQPEVTTAKIVYKDTLVGQQSNFYTESYKLLQLKDANGNPRENWAVSKTYLDGLGRAYYSESYTTLAASSKVCSGTIFDEGGRAKITTMPLTTSAQCNRNLYKISYGNILLPPNAQVPRSVTEYDYQGRVSFVEASDGSTLQTDFSLETLALHGQTITVQVSTAYAGDEADRARSESLTDLRGNLRAVREYEHGVQTSSPFVSLYNYDAQGNLIEYTDHYGNSSWFEYDSIGQKQKVLDMDLSNCGDTKAEKELCAMRYSYNQFGELVEQIDPLGQRSRNHYDAVGRLVCNDVGTLATSAAGCDCAGLVAPPTGSGRLYVDAEDQCFTYNTAQGTESAPNYDAGALQTTVDSSGTTAVRHTGPLTMEEERWICVNQFVAGGYSVSCQGAKGVSETDAAGVALSRKITDLSRGGDATTKTVKLSYDTKGRQSGVTVDGQSVAGSFQYNDSAGQGELKSFSINLPTGGNPLITSFAYNDLSISDITKRNFKLREKSTSRGTQSIQGFVIESYDKLGNIARLRDTGAQSGLGESWDYSYDKLNRLTGVTVTAPSNIVDTVSFQYDAIGNRLNLDHESSANLTGESPLMSPFQPMADITADGKVNLSDLVHFGTAFNTGANSSEHPYADLDLQPGTIDQRDLQVFVSQFAPIVGDDDVSNFGPRCLAQNVAKIQCESFYGGLSNISCPGYCSGGQENEPPPTNQVSWVYGADYYDGGEAGPHAVSADSRYNVYRYNKAGNLERYGARRIEYDKRNRVSGIYNGLILTTKPAYGTGENRVAEVRYKSCVPNGLGDDFCSGSEVVQEGVRRFFFADYETTEDDAGTNQGYLVLTAGTSRLMEIPYTTGYDTNTRIFLADHLGSVQVTLDGAGNSQHGYRTYYPFGKMRAGEESNALNRGFHGNRIDNKSGIIDFGARQYDPVLGRFLAADSIVPEVGNPQSWNRYSYVGNNPMNLVDPTGHAEGHFSRGILITTFIGDPRMNSLESGDQEIAGKPFQVVSAPKYAQDTIAVAGADVLVNDQHGSNFGLEKTRFNSIMQGLANSNYEAYVDLSCYGAGRASSVISNGLAEKAVGYFGLHWSYSTAHSVGDVVERLSSATTSSVTQGQGDYANTEVIFAGDDAHSQARAFNLLTRPIEVAQDILSLGGPGRFAQISRVTIAASFGAIQARNQGSFNTDGDFEFATDAGISTGIGVLGAYKGAEMGMKFGGRLGGSKPAGFAAGSLVGMLVGGSIGYAAGRYGSEAVLRK